MKKASVYLLIIVATLFSNFVFGAIPAEERAALIALYNATAGNNWYVNEGWKTPPLHTDGFALPGTEGNWNGVIVSNGHVIYLNFYDNNLKGRIPPELGNLNSLENLQLGRNQLSGHIPLELGNLSNLQKLDMSVNRLSGVIPSELGNLHSLKELHLIGNQLSGCIPVEFGDLDNLQYLNLLDNQLIGSIPRELGNLSNLKILRLNDNQLSGSIPPELGNLSNLQYLWLSVNQLSGSIPPELGNLNNLVNLQMAYNQLSGNIPPELGNLSSLEEMFSLCENQLSGSIPPELGNLSNLEELWLNGNHLSGSIPPELGKLSNLWGLHLNSNQLSGSIPPELGKLSNLWRLHLNSNQLSGSIPQELGNLSHLGFLDLSYNQLSGVIPSSLINLTYISYSDIDIGYNCLSTTDNALITWLTSNDPDWQATQCLEKNPPFGDFSTPISGVIVSGSIAITGWALDDYGMDSVKIYREQENALICIGDVIFIEGARPDIEIAYPGYPGNKKAGWGYMLLTNLLPNNGNGTFVIYAIAMDKFGKTTTLGAKTIQVDNVNAVKPFGTIDTPAQGGTASGKGFVNFGWALTPRPNTIPLVGSTINVVIDGMVKGHPVYNVFRSDVAALFPGYANSGGAGGYYYLDTTKLKSGLHTIAWIVSDSGGNSDGIGSRNFTVENVNRGTGINSRRGAPPCAPVFDPYSSSLTLDEIINVEIKELERVEINLSDEGVVEGYLVVADQLGELPIGSTLDKDSGIFYWQPGPGFLGTYRFMFIETDREGNTARKDVLVNITPKF